MLSVDLRMPILCIVSNVILFCPEDSELLVAGNTYSRLHPSLHVILAYFLLLTLHFHCKKSVKIHSL